MHLILEKIVDAIHKNSINPGLEKIKHNFLKRKKISKLDLDNLEQEIEKTNDVLKYFDKNGRLYLNYFNECPDFNMINNDFIKLQGIYVGVVSAARRDLELLIDHKVRPENKFLEKFLIAIFRKSCLDSMQIYIKGMLTAAIECGDYPPPYDAKIDEEEQDETDVSKHRVGLW